MKFLAGMSVLAAAVNAASVGLNKRDSPLDVKIEVVDNTGVKASITNSGAEDLRLFNQGNILDNKAVKKADVFTGSEKVKFDGLRLRVTHENLDDSAFQTIAAGKTVELTFDLAEVHDFSAGGAFDISSRGKLAYAAADSNAIAGHFDYESNLVHAEVDGSKAKSSNDAFKSAHSSILSRRTDVQSDCTGSRGSATRQAIQNCESLASAAASAARSGSASRIAEYFGSSSSSVRSQVASVLSRSASECSSTTSGNSDQYCTDVLSACQSGVLAYTSPQYAIMVNCPLYFNYLPAVARQCHAQDQATTTLHETTHLSSVAGTDDLGYGYSAATSLSTRDALNNADSYALFANAVYLNC